MIPMKKEAAALAALIDQTENVEQKFALFYLYVHLDDLLYKYFKHTPKWDKHPLFFEMEKEVSKRRDYRFGFISYDTALSFANGTQDDIYGEFKYKHTWAEACNRILLRDVSWNPLSRISLEYSLLLEFRSTSGRIKLVDGQIAYGTPCPYGNPYETVLPEDTRSVLMAILSDAQVKKYWERMFDKQSFDLGVSTRRALHTHFQRIPPETQALIRECVDSIDYDKVMAVFEKTKNDPPEKGSMFDQIKTAIENGEEVDEMLVYFYKREFPE
jgi:hypothetical protein